MPPYGYAASHDSEAPPRIRHAAVSYSRRPAPFSAALRRHMISFDAAMRHSRRLSMARTFRRFLLHAASALYGRLFCCHAFALLQPLPRFSWRLIYADTPPLPAPDAVFRLTCCRRHFPLLPIDAAASPMLRRRFHGERRYAAAAATEFFCRHVTPTLSVISPKHDIVAKERRRCRRRRCRQPFR